MTFHPEVLVPDQTQLLAQLSSVSQKWGPISPGVPPSLFSSATVGPSTSIGSLEERCHQPNSFKTWQAVPDGAKRLRFWWAARRRLDEIDHAAASRTCQLATRAPPALVSE